MTQSLDYRAIAPAGMKESDGGVSQPIRQSL